MVDKKNAFNESKSTNNSSSVAPADAGEALEKLCLLIEQVEALCEKLIAIGEFGPVITALEAICKKLLEAISNLESLVECIKELKDIMADITKCFEELKKINLEQLECLKAIKDLPQPTIEECCTGGATPETAVCFNIPASLASGDNPNCSYNIFGQDMPNPYTPADVEAALPPGSTMIQTSPTTYNVCTSTETIRCYRSFCRAEGGLIGSLTRLCWTALPNTAEEECINVQRTWGKYEEPIGNTLEGIKSVNEEMLVCLQEIKASLICTPDEGEG